MTEPRTLAEVAAAIQAGKPQTLKDAATAFKAMANAVTTLAGDASKEVDNLTGGADPPWEDDAATAFSGYMEDFDSRMDKGATAIQKYEQPLNDAAQALVDAQKEIATLTGTVPAKPEDQAALDAKAQQILDTLSGKYDTATAQLTPMPDAAKNGGDGGANGGGGGAKAGGGDAKAGGADAKDGGDEPKDGGDEPKDGDPKGGGDEPKGGGAGEPGSDSPAKGGTPAGETPLFINDPTKSPAPMHLGNPDSPLVDQPKFGGRPDSSLFYSDPSGGGGPTTGIGRDSGADPSTVLTRLPSGTGAPGPGTPGPGTPVVSTPSGPVTLGPGPGGPGLILPTQRSALTTSGPSRSRATESDKGTEPARTGQRAPMMPLYPSGVIGRQEERAAERETWLIGDEDWNDTGAADDAIGRPSSQAPGS